MSSDAPVTDPAVVAPTDATVVVPPVDATVVVPSVDPLADVESKQLQDMLDVMYKQLMTLCNGNFNTANCMNVVFQLIQDCNTYSITDSNKLKVILMAVDKFCVEHQQDSLVFAHIEPFAKFALQLANGTIHVNVPAIEADVKAATSSCFPCFH